MAGAPAVEPQVSHFDGLKTGNLVLDLTKVPTADPGVPGQIYIDAGTGAVKISLPAA